MKTRTLIVDDEQLARERLRQLLAEQADFEVVGECGDGASAVAAVRDLAPDLIFLDIHMPELDGFAVLEAIDLDPPPIVVFVTAYDQFALKAFEVHAVDYLLKPFDRERFQIALQRAGERLHSRERNAVAARQAAVLNELKPPPITSDRLPVKTGGRILFIKISDIDWVESAHNYVELHVHKESHLLRETLGAFEARLAPDKFVRISRSTIVNIERIKELRHLFHGGYTVILHNGATLTLSRRYRDKLKQLGL